MKIISLVLLSVLVGCGKAKEMPKFNQELMATDFPADGSNIGGRYKVEFVTLNDKFIELHPTSGLIDRKGDKFQVQIKLTGGAPSVWHKQDLHNGWRCPTLEQDDKNHDNIIDVEEGSNAWGKPIIPLDSNLKGQDLGKNLYPVADETGAYLYKRNANFTELFKDLKKTPDSKSSFIKLAKNEGLSLAGNIIVIYGADFNVNLPETVAMIEGRDRHQSLPVACGLIIQSSPEPGTIDTNISGNMGNPEPARTWTPPAPTPEPVPEPVPVPEVDPLPVPQPEPVPVPVPVPVPQPEPEPETDDEDEDDDDDGWDDVWRRWFRRTWGGGGGGRN
ncbi:MAG TPA: hypothetical protein VNJ08_12300 [Bacteriovoracaceae bacterium]|nr:hypothetical protein [Bacteriovoracaceae bacterium]